MRVITTPDIVIIRDTSGYRLLHGHLHLANALSNRTEVLVDSKEAGQIKIMKTATGLMAHQDNQFFPLLRD